MERKLVAAKEKEITRLSGVYRNNLDGSGVTIVEARATVKGAEPRRARRWPRNSGRPHFDRNRRAAVVPAGLEGAELAISSNEIFDLPVFPRRLLVVGGGYIAVEFASLFRRLGAEVVEVLRGDNVLRGFDEDMRVGLRDEMTRAGVKFRFGVLPTRIAKTADGLEVGFNDGEIEGFDQVLVATGRAPNTRGLGLEAVGVELDAKGAVKVDADATSSVAVDPRRRRRHRPHQPDPGRHPGGPFARRSPVRRRDGAGGSRECRDRRVHYAGNRHGRPDRTPSSSEISSPRHLQGEFRPMKATLTGSGERTIMKLIVDAASDRVVGAHLLGGESGEIIQALAIAIKMGATKRDFDATMAVHPTAAEELVTMRTRTARITREAVE